MVCPHSNMRLGKQLSAPTSPGWLIRKKGFEMTASIRYLGLIVYFLTVVAGLSACAGGGNEDGTPPAGVETPAPGGAGDTPAPGGTGDTPAPGAGFQLDLSTASVGLSPGGSADATVTLTPQGGWSGCVPSLPEECMKLKRLVFQASARCCIKFCLSNRSVSVKG